MQFGIWVAIGLLAFGLQLYWMRYEDRIPVTTLPAGYLWMIWGLHASNIETGTTDVVVGSYPEVAYLGYFMMLVNFALLLMWLVTDEDEDVLTDQF